MRARRRERATLWQDSGFMQDSFFGVDSQGELAATSGFGALRSGVSVREIPASIPPEAGGVVVDTPASQLGH